MRLNRRMDKLDTLAKRFAAARKHAGLTQAKLSELSGVQQSDISKLQRGDVSKSTGLAALARALQCDVDWLDTGEGEPDYGRVARGWPFPDIPRQRFVDLNDRQRLELQGAVRKMIIDFEGGAAESIDVA